jgi:alpha-ketoglutarate-dependent taurine dioxygenase
MSWSLSESTFPTVLEQQGIAAGLEDCLEIKSDLRALLLKAGALLIRGLPVPMPQSVAQFASAFSGQPIRNYVGGASPRQEVAPGVYTSTEYPPALNLSLHNEMSYTYRWPSYLFFMCTAAAVEGGETPIADSRALLRRIPSSIVEEFSRKKIRYVRRLPTFRNDGYSWQEAFETNARSAVEKYCSEGKVDFDWNRNGDLELREIRPATAIHPVTGEEVWFNQADSFYSGGDVQSRLDVSFADGSSISKEEIAEIRAAMTAETVLFKWRAGDILVLDNLLAAHGRRPFTGPRKILLAMT